MIGRLACMVAVWVTATPAQYEYGPITPPSQSVHCYTISFVQWLESQEDIRADESKSRKDLGFRWRSGRHIELSLRADGIWVLPPALDLEILASANDTVGCVADWMLEHRSEISWVDRDTDKLLPQPLVSCMCLGMTTYYRSPVARACPMSNGESREV